MNERQYHVYLLASRKHGTLYVGVTGHLARRIHEHKSGAVPGFTRRYAVHRLVYVEAFDQIAPAIQREKTIKRWPRAWKIRTIEELNPDWRDLYEDILR